MNRKERRIAAKSGLVTLPGQSSTPATASFLTTAEAYYRSGRLHEADAICASLLATEPHHAPALLMRGLISNQQGRPADAVTFLKRAVTLAPTVVAVHYGLAEAYRAVAKPADAERHFRRSAELQPGAVPLLNLGNILMELRRPAAAAAIYQSALRFDARLPETPGFALAYEGMIDACLAAGAWDAAWQAASHALMRSDTPKLRMLFVSSISSATPTTKTPGLREAMQRAIAERWTRARAACAIVALRRPTDLEDGLLRTLLELALICHREIEQTLIEQRRTFLETAASGATLRPAMLEAACALARQCFITEYVWDCTTECGLVDDLRRSIQAELDRGLTPSDTVVVAAGMYFPLASLIGGDRLLADCRPPYVTAVLAQQISEPATERELRSLIPRATSVDDEISQAVRDQYEANPYPRWVATSGTSHRLQLEKWLAARFSGTPVAPLPTQAVLEVLVAGCGTGQQPIELMRQFANINVLDIDLSMASLAYASRMTAVHGVQGIEYLQADLLQMAQFDRSFDVIAAAGVLHHLADLWTGWRILLGLLRPGGVMTASLYTVRGRSDVMRAREWIAAHGYDATPEGIRRCRRDLLALHDDWAIRVSSSPDFCSSSACRDLLFHVHEQAVTPLEVSEFLMSEGMTLLGVLVSPGTERAFNAWAGGAHLEMARDLSR